LNIGATPVDPVELKESLKSGRLTPDSVDADGRTPLHSAIDVAAVDAVRVLLDANADVNVSDRWGNGPLWRAVYHAPGTVAIIELLLERGADPTAKNNHDVSALDLARKLADDHKEIADLLPSLEDAAAKFGDGAQA
jgi:ankyrin repeat protein